MTDNEKSYSAADDLEDVLVEINGDIDKLSDETVRLTWARDAIWEAMATIRRLEAQVQEDAK